MQIWVPLKDDSKSGNKFAGVLGIHFDMDEIAARLPKTTLEEPYSATYFGYFTRNHNQVYSQFDCTQYVNQEQRN